MRRELERIEVPSEHAARERAWEVVRTAWEQREPAPRRRSLVRPALVVAALLAVLGAILSPPGRALVDEVREAIGVERAAPALFSLPTGGELLVSSDRGVWVVRRDGSTRLLGAYREASWSPFGRFVVATRAHELLALEPDGDIRWKLARPGVRLPRWGGTRSDTRIAYLSGSTLRVVAGDGTGDRPIGPAARVAPAWRPRARHVLAYVDARGSVVTLNVERRRVLWRTPAQRAVAALEWSSDGRRLHVRRGGRVDVLTGEGAPFTAVRPERGIVTAATFRPGTHAGAYAIERNGRSEVVLVGEPSAVLFRGPGRLTDLQWSPDGRWLLVAWSAADQWLFVDVDGRPRVRAVAAIASQFRTATPPVVEGWCCAAR